MTDDTTGEIEDRNIGELLEAAVEAVKAAEEKAKQANTERKAARNRLAELLQGLGVNGFQMGG